MKTGKTLVIMVGIAGSGKTTIAKDIKRKYDGTLIASDDIRSNLRLGQSSEAHRKVFDEVHRQVDVCMSLDTPLIIVDATNLKSFFRQAYLDLADKYHYKKIAYVVEVDPKTCIKNVQNRDRSVPKDVILRQAAHYDKPKVEEGWDEINVITGFKETVKNTVKQKVASFLKKIKKGGK